MSHLGTRPQFWLAPLLALTLSTTSSAVTLPQAQAKAQTSAVEFFAKGSASKNHLSPASFTVNVSMATGIGITLVPQLRIEGRYTNNSSLQNRIDVNTGQAVFTLNEIKTSTTIYSIGLDFDILSRKFWVQPFIYLGVGYIETERSYYVRPDELTTAVFREEPRQTGLSGNVGLGFRVRIVNAVAFEAEAFAYGRDIHKPNPVLDLYGLIGIRVFL